MSEKKCPMCAEMVKAEALICRFCRYEFETREEPVTEAEDNEESNSYVGVILATLFIGAFLLICYKLNQDEKSESNTNTVNVSDDVSEKFSDLKGTAIINLGWIVGNSKKSPIWNEMKEYVGEKGVYYKGLMLMATPGKDHSSEARRNLYLYNDGLRRGEGENFNDDEIRDRLIRINQITTELTNMLKEMNN